MSKFRKIDSDNRISVNVSSMIIDDRKVDFYFEQNELYKIIIGFPFSSQDYMILNIKHIVNKEINNSCKNCVEIRNKKSQMIDKKYSNCTLIDVTSIQDENQCDKCFMFNQNSRRCLLISFKKEIIDRLRLIEYNEEKPDIGYWKDEMKFTNLFYNKFFTVIEKKYLGDKKVSNYFLHNDNPLEPSFIQYNNEGKTVKVVYCKEGLIHNDNTYAYIVRKNKVNNTYRINNISYIEGRKTNLGNKPAKFVTNSDGSTREIVHYKNGVKHNEETTRTLIYSGDSETTFFYRYGFLATPKDGLTTHNTKWKNGDLLQQWFHYGYNHRIGGPSIIEENEGEIIEEYWLYDEEYTEEEYYNILERVGKIGLLWKEKKREKVNQILNKYKYDFFHSKDIINLVCKLY